MLIYYTINTLLIVVGGVFFMGGGACTWVSLGNYKAAKDWFGIWLGVFFMVLAIGLWYLAGSYFPDGFRFALLGE